MKRNLLSLDNSYLLSSKTQKNKIKISEQETLNRIHNSEFQNESRISKTLNELEKIIKEFQNNKVSQISSSKVSEEEGEKDLMHEFKKTINLSNNLENENLNNTHQFFKTTLEPNDMNFLRLTLQENNDIQKINSSNLKEKNKLGKKSRSNTKSLFHIRNKKSIKPQSVFNNNKKTNKPKSQVLSRKNKSQIYNVFDATKKKKINIRNKKKTKNKNNQMPRHSNGLILKQKRPFPIKKKTKKQTRKEDFDKFSQISNNSIKTQKILN